MKIKNLDELIGKRVVVTADNGTLGYLIREKHLTNRRIGRVGTVQGWVPGHGGDVVWLIHEDPVEDEDPAAAYCHLTELEFYSEQAVEFAKQKLARLSPLYYERERLQADIRTIEQERMPQ